MIIAIIPSDKMVVIDGVGVRFDFEIAAGIHAVQWSGNSGHVEFSDGSQNQEITDISPYQSIIDAHGQIIQQAEADRIAFENSWECIRGQRNHLLAACDWTQMPDSPLPPEKKSAWAAYRQALRDITETYPAPADVVWPTPPE